MQGIETRKVVTFVTFFAHFSMGILYSGFGTALPTLACKLKTDLKSLSILFAVRASGALLGCLSSGPLYNKVNPLYYLSALFLVSSACLISTPFWSTAIPIMVVLALIGFTLGTLDTMGNAIILNIWKKGQTASFQSVKLGFSVGGVISPYMISSFLLSTEELNIYKNDTNSKNLDVSKKLSSFYWVFMIFSFFLITASVGFLVTSLFFKLPGKKKINEKVIVKENHKFRIKILALLFVFFVIYLGVVDTFWSYLYSFATNAVIGLTKNEGTVLMSVFFAANSLGRFFSVLLSFKLPGSKQLYLNYFGFFASSVILLFYSSNHSNLQWVLWVGLILFSFSLSSIYGNLLVWIAQHLTIDSNASMIATVGTSIGEIFIPFAIGRILEDHPMSIIYTAAIFSFAEAIVFAMIFYLVHTNKNKVEKGSSKNDRNILENTEVVENLM